MTGSDAEAAAAVGSARVERPWGWFETLLDGPGYRLKRLCVRSGQRISLQRHRQRSEQWVVVAGSGHVEIEGRSHPCELGSTFTVPCGSVHRATAGDADLLIIEVQLGEQLSESDIERFADDYGRAGGVEG